jgi:hypothetical protein
VVPRKREPFVLCGDGLFVSFGTYIYGLEE